MHESHGTGAEHLCNAEEAIHPLGGLVVQREVEQGHDDEAQDEAGDRGCHHGDNHFPQ